MSHQASNDNRSAETPGRSRATPNDSVPKTLAVAVSVCLVCSLLVSASAVVLRPRQLANLQQERMQHIQRIIESVPGIGGILTSVDARDADVEARVVDLETGKYVRNMDPAEYDQREAARDPRRSVALAPASDLAGLGRRARWATVYLVKQDDQLSAIVLPVHGSGYASTLRGFLTLGGDANTIIGLSFYEHGETPGIGAQIDSAEWQARWQGKLVRDDAGVLRVRVGPGRVDSEGPDARYAVDALSGATGTSQGVSNLVRFWLGAEGFGPYLDTVQEEGG